MEEFDIIEYLSGLTTYVFDKAVLKRIAYEREVEEVTDYAELDQRTKDLLLADVLYTAYLSPNIIASSTQSHGSYTKSIGSQTTYSAEKERLYNTFFNIYSKYEDDKLEGLQDNSGNMQWL